MSINQLVIDNWPRALQNASPNHPQKPDWGKRPMPMSNELWIEREDFMEVPTKGYFRLFPGNQVRLKYGFVVRCTGYSKDDATGKVTEVHCDYLPETKSGTPGAEAVKVKGTIHCLVNALRERGGSTIVCSKPLGPRVGNISTT